MAALLLVGAGVALLWTLNPTLFTALGGSTELLPTATTVAQAQPTAQLNPTSTVLPTKRARDFRLGRSADPRAFDYSNAPARR